MFSKQLFGLNKGGTYKVWSITTMGDSFDADLKIEHGVEGGKMTVKIDNFKSGKQGRDAIGQAIFEAQARIKKQMDKGYRETKDELEDLPVLAMLAMDFHKNSKRMTYPCFTSRKLDGVRALAHRLADKVVLKSRTNQDYSVTHVEETLMKVMPVGAIWDGELYIENSCLEDIVSSVKKRNDKTKLVEFIVFDVVSDEEFKDRLHVVNAIPNFECVRPIEYLVAFNDSDVVKQQKVFTDEGFEGIMLRTENGAYESGKRSSGLMKRKDFLDSEFEILDVIADKQGHGVFVLQNDLTDDTFQCVMGSMTEREEYLSNKDRYIGKMLTVKYQTRYRDTKLCQFPTGVAIRDYE